MDHGGVWLVELSKCAIDVVTTGQERWLKFFVEGEQLAAARGRIPLIRVLRQIQQRTIMHQGLKKALAGLLIDIPVMPFDAFTLTVALRSIAQPPPAL